MGFPGLNGGTISMITGLTLLDLIQAVVIAATIMTGKLTVVQQPQSDEGTTEMRCKFIIIFSLFEYGRIYFIIAHVAGEEGGERPDVAPPSTVIIVQPRNTSSPPEQYPMEQPYQYLP